MEIFTPKYSLKNIPHPTYAFQLSLIEKNKSLHKKDTVEDLFLS